MVCGDAEGTLPKSLLLFCSVTSHPYLRDCLRVEPKAGLGADCQHGALSFNLLATSMAVYIGQSPEQCVPLSSGPGKVCGESIGLHCGGKVFVWAADPDCTGQRTGISAPTKRSGLCGGASVVCPSLLSVTSRSAGGQISGPYLVHGP